MYEYKDQRLLETSFAENDKISHFFILESDGEMKIVLGKFIVPTDATAGEQ